MPTPGPLELVIILVIALLILGPGKLPDVGAALGKSIREFRKASSDVQEAVKIDTSPIAPVAAPAAPVAPVVAPPAAVAPAEPVAAAPAASEPTSGTN
jgi:TatA/E family protein of Tat protein translocase